MCKEICSLLLSRPSRGAWIEIDVNSDTLKNSKRRAPRGARGLKYKLINTKTNEQNVAPLAGRVD